MPTRAQVLRAIGADLDYVAAARLLGVPAGQAYLIATGLPADGGDELPPGERGRPGVLPAGTQALVYSDAAAATPTGKPRVRRWIEERVAADGPLRQAAERHPVPPGLPEDSDDTADTDVAVVLTRDHDRMSAMLRELKAIPGVTQGGSESQRSRRKAIVDAITVALSKHESAEEEHLWPAVRSALRHGDGIVETALHQEQKGRQLLHRLGELSPSTDEFDELAEELETAASQHVAFEDRVLLALESTLRGDERAELGRRIRQGEKPAPATPRRRSPKSRAPASKAARPAAAGTDKAPSAVGDRPAKRRSRARQATPEPGKTEQGKTEQERDAGGKE